MVDARVGDGAEVFPAQAGMNRSDFQLAAPDSGVPRTGGDEPDKAIRGGNQPKCSPHRRG